MESKKKILVVDDDLYFRQRAKERLTDEGYEAAAAGSLEEAKKLMDERRDFDAVVIDVMMPPAVGSEFEAHSGHQSGVLLARWVKEHYPQMTVVGISGGGSLDAEEWFRRQNMAFFEKEPELFDNITHALSKKYGTGGGVTTFIVHGHDEAAKYELKNYLQNTLNLPEPIILHEQPSQGRTVIEKFEDVVRRVDLVFVLLTPDDGPHGPASTDDEKRRARQNVVFEMGYFFGKLQRKKGRVLLLHKGPLELPSDIAGIVYIDISAGVELAGELIRKELASVL